MSTVSWTSFSNGNWSDGGNWDNGGAPPGSGDDAVIDLFSFYTVSLTASVTVNSIAFSNSDGVLQVENPGSVDTVTTFYSNAGGLSVDSTGAGGSTLNIGGTLTNSGTVILGNAGMTSAGSLSAGDFANTGRLFINGGSTNGATAMMLIAAAAPGTLTGFDTLTASAGGAVLSWGSGSITQIGDNDLGFAALSLDGAGAIAEIGTTGGTSALANLATIANNGQLSLSDGATLTTQTGLTIVGGGFDGGTLAVDATGTGGSHLTVGGDLFNDSTAAVFNFAAATVNVGNAAMTSAGTLTVDGTFDDDNSNLVINGGAVAGAMAVMDMTGAAPATLTGSIDLVGNAGGAAMRWGSGGITQIGDGASIGGEVTLDGANVFMAIGPGNNNNALASLATIAGNGVLELDDGVVLASPTPLTVTNGGSLIIDGPGETGAGGSTITLGGLTLSSSFLSEVELGSPDMSVADTLTVDGALSNTEGFIDVQGGNVAGATANLDVNGAAPGTLIGSYSIEGDTGGAVLRWNSGAITQLGDGSDDSSLVLSGADADAAIGGGDNDSAIDDLATIATNASLVLNDALVNTATSLTVDSGGALLIDPGSAGGSDVTIGGDVLDQAPYGFDQGVNIGNSLMTESDTLTVDGTLNANGGFVDVEGGNAAGVTAKLIETSAAPGTITGYYALGEVGTNVPGTIGTSDLEWASGGIVQIGDGSDVGGAGGGFFSIAGPNTHAEIGDTNSNSALSSLRTIASNGGLVVSFGATVVTTGSLTVDFGGQIYLDGGDHDGGGGSSLTIGGDLINDSSEFSSGIQVGNSDVTLPETLTVDGNFDNTYGRLVLTGGTSNGALAQMNVTGAAPGTMTGSYDIGPTVTVTAGGIIFQPHPRVR